MNIIGKIKGLLFGASNAVDNKTKFSESYVLAAQQRAEPLVRELNESLNIANKSKSKRIREERLQIARDRLIELNKLTIKFPFLSLQNLQAVEARIKAVEAETISFPISEAGGNQFVGQHHSTSDEQAILMSIQGYFRVVNESIEIARKSKNLETKLSRLRVARDSLKEAQIQANQFSLEVGGFAEAEAEINRIDEAIKAGTPTEIPIMQQTDANAAYSSTARNLLKEATELKKAKKYIEACEKLREAYSADGAENLFVEERLRLPMYLQLAGKNDEGWDELNRLYASYDLSFQPRIEHQMKVFLRKEKNESALNPARVILRGDNKPLEATPNESRLKMLDANVVRREASMQVMNESRMATFKANDELIASYQFVSALDSHVCPLCGARDGLRWTPDHEPIGHSLRFANPPLHVGCRCVIIPVTKTWAELGVTGMPETKIGTRASTDGQVPASTTFEQFLRRKGAAWQDEVLGVGRAQIWRDKKLTLQDLVDEFGRELTLDELRAKNSK